MIEVGMILLVSLIMWRIILWAFRVDKVKHPDPTPPPWNPDPLRGAAVYDLNEYRARKAQRLRNQRRRAA